MVFNADAVSMVKLLDIGTRQAFTFPEAANTQGNAFHAVATG
jgi:hypothetical protein